jgi:hypothetical protein
MMRFLVCLFGLFLYSSNTADTYYVTFTLGKVTIMDNGVVLKTGDAINYSTALAVQFGTTNDMAAVVNPRKGRFKILPVKVTKKSSGEFWGFLKDNLFLSKEQIPVSARQGLFNNEVDMEQFFGSHKIAIFSRREFPINKSFAETPDDKFFFIRYDHAGDQISKRLVFSTDKSNGVSSLVIDEDVLQIDGKTIQQEQVSNMSLYFYDRKKEESRRITPLQLIFSSRQKVSGEIAILARSLNTLYGSASDRQEKIINEVQNHLAEYYGNIEEPLLSEFLAVVRK